MKCLSQSAELKPYGWWNSGRLWYCFVDVDGRRVSGAGKTKDEAVSDALKDVRRIAGKRMQSKSGADHDL